MYFEIGSLVNVLTYHKNSQSTSLSTDLPHDLILSFLLFAYWDALIVPSETATSIFRSEQRAMFSENATEHKFMLIHGPCCFLPCCKVNHEANILNMEENLCRFSAKYRILWNQPTMKGHNLLSTWKTSERYVVFGFCKTNTHRVHTQRTLTLLSRVILQPLVKNT